VPGIGKLLSLVRWDAIHAIARFPSVQDFVSDGRLVTCAKASAGTRDGTAGTKMGHASLTWAVSEAAVLCLRDHPAGQTSRARLENTPSTGKALTVLAPNLARAVSDRLNRGVGFDLDKFFHRSRGGADEPAASLGDDGLSLATVRCHHTPRASTNAHEHIGPVPGPCACDWTPASPPVHMARGPPGCGVLPRTRTWNARVHRDVQPRF
jgi:Transposase IS116/IS110/IS902 family